MNDAPAGTKTLPTQPLCFVASPIGEAGSIHRIHADFLYQYVIIPVMTAECPTYRVKRADLDARPGQIDVHMIRDLHDSELVIANLSFRNPNVFYEIGIRHVLRKKIIHMQLSGEERIFDVAGYRTVPFSVDSVQAIDTAKSDLTEQIRQVMVADYVVSNPVTNALGVTDVENKSTPLDKIIMLEIDSIKRRLNRIDDIERRIDIIKSINSTLIDNDQGKITAKMIRDILLQITSVGSIEDWLQAEKQKLTTAT